MISFAPHHQDFQGELLVGVRRYSVGELHPSKVPQHVVYVGAETQVAKCLVVEVDVGTSLFSRRESLFSSSSSDNMMKPYEEYIGVYGGGAVERVDRRGGTGGSSVCP
jgi:hypothetical protein